MKVSDYIASVIGKYNPFVVQGGAAIHLIDSLYRGGYKYVCTAHEQAAGFAADGYAKMKGLGVAITTCGPGATNLLTPACSAWFEKVPVLYLVGQQHDFQEIDVVGMFDSVTHYCKQIVDPATVESDLANAIRKAVEEQGPVLLNIFDEVYRADYDFGETAFEITPYSAPETDLIFSKKRNKVEAFPASMNPYYFMQELKLNNRDHAIVTDIGNHGVWVKQMSPAISDNNFGAMGYAIAASMGVACAGYPVVSINGDGGIQMNIQELATISKHDMDIKIFILNNGGYGMIRCTQDTWLEKRHAGCDMNDLPFVDFQRIANSYGIDSYCWETNDDIDFSILDKKGPVLIDVTISPDQGVL